MKLARDGIIIDSDSLYEGREKSPAEVNAERLALFRRRREALTSITNDRLARDASRRINHEELQNV